ncbi:MAG: hypothetical protein LBT04_06225 [Prevotellaceae bacterium]|jgi:hypothetical protein|nr:hypothetical protein [Prevotellaceae bacterium]
MTQQEIIDLLNAAHDNSFNADELAISAQYSDYSRSLEVNRTLKKSLHKIDRNNSFSYFEYIDNLTSYTYGSGYTGETADKYSENLSDDFWNTNPFENGGDWDWELNIFTFTVSGNVFTGVWEDATIVIELTENRLLKRVVSSDGSTFNFSYTNVNPAFPAGFSKDDFPLKQEYGGTGTFTYTLATDQPLVIDGAIQETSQYTPHTCRIIFYKDGESIGNEFKFHVSFPENFTRLPAGTYVGTYNGDDYSFSAIKGHMGGIVWYDKGGNVTVTINGDIYTITIDMDTSTNGGIDGTPGKIRGTYTGYLPVVNN